MKILNNIRWDLDGLLRDIQLKWCAVEEEGRIPYGVLIHPETFADVVSDEKYRSYVYMPSSFDSRLFGFKAVINVDATKNEWELLVKEP